MISYYSVVETKFGFIALAGKDGMLTHSTLPKQSRDEAFKHLQAGLDQRFVEDVAAFGDLPGKLVEYFNGKRVNFSNIQADISNYGAFHQKVLKACRNIPYGVVVTYQELAREAGSERAYRSAGSAMARNNMPIIIPCHRVLASGGKIGGFASGLEWKRNLLRLEGVDI